MARLDIRALTLQIAEAEARIAVQEQVLLRLKNGTRPEEVAQTRAEVVPLRPRRILQKQHSRRACRKYEQNSGGQAVSQQDLDSARIPPPRGPGTAGKPEKGAATGSDRPAATKTSPRLGRS